MEGDLGKQGIWERMRASGRRVGHRGEEDGYRHKPSPLIP